MLWLIFIAPPATLLALLRDFPFNAFWLNSLFFLPIPLLLLISVFRSKNASLRWWVFQYLGVSAIGFSAAVAGTLLSFFMAPSAAGITASVLFALFLLVAIVAAHRIHLTPLQINSPKISERKRLVHISDVHIGSRRAAFLEKIISLVNRQNPDMLLITGDLIDENVPADALQSLASLNYPVFYSSGNHERYVDYQSALDNIASHGVSVLTDSTIVSNQLHIMGIEDRQHLTHARDALNKLCTVNNMPEDSFKILLYHQPDLWASAILQDIDLTLSGHTHNGQIWPFGWLVRTRYEHIAGHFRSALCHLFVSQGTGTWGPTLRFGTRCEIAVIELRPADN